MRNDMSGWTKHPRPVDWLNIFRQWRFQSVRVVKRKPLVAE